MDRKKKIALLLLAALALLVAGYGAGRYATPAKVVTKTEVKTQIEYKDRVVDHVVTQVQVVHDKDEHKQTVIKWTTAPDGKPQVTETVTSDTQSDTKINAGQTSDHRGTTTEQVKQEVVTKTVTTYARPQWSLAVQPGFQFGDAIGGGKSSYDLLRAIPLQHLVGNVVLERRLAGPLLIGAWANTRLDGGLSLRLEW